MSKQEIPGNILNNLHKSQLIYITKGILSEIYAFQIYVYMGIYVIHQKTDIANEFLSWNLNKDLSGPKVHVLFSPVHYLYPLL